MSGQTPQQVVRIIDWTTLVNARDQMTEFPVVYPFGAVAPDYLSIGEVSQAFAGRRSAGDGPPVTGNIGRAFIELDPYGWVP